VSALRSRFSGVPVDGLSTIRIRLTFFYSMDDLIDDLRTALVQAGAVTMTVNGLTAGVPPEVSDGLVDGTV
jgi:hypothetical protein